MRCLDKPVHLQTESGVFGGLIKSTEPNAPCFLLLFVLTFFSYHSPLAVAYVIVLTVDIPLGIHRQP